MSDFPWPTGRIAGPWDDRDDARFYRDAHLPNGTVMLQGSDKWWIVELGEIAYRCPDSPFEETGEPHTILGCGRTFTISVYDLEGMDDCVDCPNCGIFWPISDNRVA